MKDEPSRTAEMVCLYRAAERRRPEPERALDDPFAKWFLGPLTRTALATLEATGRLGRLAEDKTPTGLSTYIVARHRFIDDALTKALAAGAEQVVLLGAGYDTRAYRFADQLGERPVYELDFFATSRRKQEIVQAHRDELPSVAVTAVEIDFLRERIEDVLTGVGFALGRRTFFVWEGVSMYLTRDAVKSTLDTLRALGGPGSQVAMDFWFLLDSTDWLSTLRRASASLLHLLGEPITFGIHPEDAPSFLERQGFVVDDLADPSELQRRYLTPERSVYPACFVLTASATSDPATS
ncbi:MAG: SAM-dependent methyltransferase [Deltaproteobacteria bacterium]